MVALDSIDDILTLDLGLHIKKLGDFVEKEPHM